MNFPALLQGQPFQDPAPIPDDIPHIYIGNDNAEAPIRDARITHEYMRLPAGATRCIIPKRAGAMTRLRFNRSVVARLMADDVDVSDEFVGEFDMVRLVEPRWEKLQRTMANVYRPMILTALQKPFPSELHLCSSCCVRHMWLEFSQPLTLSTMLEIELVMPWIKYAGQEYATMETSIEVPCATMAAGDIDQREWWIGGDAAQVVYWFVLMLVIGDGWLALGPAASASVGRFARIFQRLPRELQERICGAVYGLEKMITAAEVEEMLAIIAA